MSADHTVSIIAPAGRRKNYVANDVPVQKLAIYSQVARYRYVPSKDCKNPLSEGDKRNTNAIQFDLGEGMNEEFARTIATHIKRCDPASPAPLTLALFGTERSLEELVQIWRIIGQGYKCPRELHDETIRDDLRRKMYDTRPFLFSHFKLIVENLGFDRGIVHSAMDRVTFLHIKGYLHEKTKMEVEKYCQGRDGWWDQLLETLGRVEVKTDGAAEQKAAREKAKAERQGSRSAGRGREGQGRNGGSNSNGGKATTGKGKGSKPVEPFKRNDDDFPPLS